MISVARRLAAPAAVAVLLAVGYAVPAHAATAATASGRGWSISQTFSGTPGPIFQSITTAGPDRAWVFGSGVSLTAESWNGLVWSPLPTPLGFGDQGNAVNDAAAAASSPTDLWTLASSQDPVANTTTWYALHWNGVKWAEYKLPSALGVVGVGALGVVSASDVWAFGDGDAYHFNGHVWRQAVTPGLFFPQVSTFGADDVWAIGDTAATIDSASPTELVAHWNGKRWQTRPVPKFPLSGTPTIVQDATVVKPSGMWAVEGFPVNRCGCQPPPAGLLLAHRTGQRWQVVLRDTVDYAQGTPAPDGHGGLWEVALDVSTGQDVLLHYTHGTLQRLARPSGSQLTAFVARPARATFVWVLGSTGAAGEPAILRYQP
jgi:hypothetical protein